MGTSHIDSVVETISSATPLAALHKIFAVAGATMIASSSNERFTWSIPPFGLSGNIAGQLMAFSPYGENESLDIEVGVNPNANSYATYEDDQCNEIRTK